MIPLWIWTKSIASLLERVDHSRCHKNICDSWKQVKLSILTGVWKNLIPNLMDDFEGFKTSVEEVTEDVLEIAK